MRQTPAWDNTDSYAGPRPYPPALLWLLGEPGIGVLLTEKDGEDIKVQAARLFPEARVEYTFYNR